MFIGMMFIFVLCFTMVSAMEETEVLFFVSEDTIYALDIDSQDYLLNYEDSDVSGLTVGETHLFYESNDYIKALSIGSGDISWTYFPDDIDGTYYFDGIFYFWITFSSSSESKVYALDEQTGNLLFSVDDYCSSLVVFDEVLYCVDTLISSEGSYPYSVSLYDRLTGDLIYNYILGEDISPPVTSVFVYDDVMYLESGLESVRAVDLSDYSTLWEFDPSSQSGNFQTPFVYDDVLYAKSGSRIYSLDLDDGAENWYYSTVTTGISSVVDWVFVDDSLIVLDASETLDYVNLDTGVVEFTESLEDYSDWRGVSPLIAYEDEILFANDEFIYSAYIQEDVVIDTIFEATSDIEEETFSMGDYYFCSDSSDCSEDSYCDSGLCVEGSCSEELGECQIELEECLSESASTPYECYSDDQCIKIQTCEEGFCVANVGKKLPFMFAPGEEISSNWVYWSIAGVVLVLVLIGAVFYFTRPKKAKKGRKKRK